MIQVYKYPDKELYIIKDTIPDMVFMDITKEQAKEILKVYKREHRDRLGENAINANELKIDKYDTIYKGIKVENYIKLAKIMRGDKDSEQ